MEITLQNTLISAVFETTSGALVSLKNSTTGWEIVKREPSSPAFDMLIPVHDKRNNTVDRSDCELVKQTANDISFRYTNISTPCTGVLEITLTVAITLYKDHLLFEAKVENNSKYTVEVIDYPVFANISADSTGKTLYRMNGQYAGLEKTEIYPSFQNNCGYWGVDYPTQTVKTPRTMYMILGNDRHGMYTACHDSSLKELVQFILELKPGYADTFDPIYPSTEYTDVPRRLVCRVNHFPYAHPGETAELSPIAVAPYTGTWHKGIDLYKKWRDTWYTAPETPRWIKEVHSWLQLHINSPEDELRCRFTDLKRYGEECVKHGVAAIQLVGWNYGGQDRGNPSHNPDPRLGSTQELKDAIAYIQSLGVHVILFNKYTWSERSTEWFRKELIDYAAKDPYGDYTVCDGYRYQTATQLADINTRRLVPMCHHSSKWLDICSAEVKKSVDLGAAGILYDECQHHGGVTYCFDPSHGHKVPANVFASDTLLAARLREAANNPDFLFSGEALYDLEYKDYSMAYFRIEQSHIPVERYIDSQSNIMVAVTGFNDRGMLNACLRYRYVISYEPYMFKGSLEDFPATLAYGKKIDALRRSYRGFLWDGEFLDTQECSVNEDGREYPHYGVYRSADGKHAAVLVNDKNEAIELRVHFTDGHYLLCMASPENQTAAVCGDLISIPAKSAVVVMETNQ